MFNSYRELFLISSPKAADFAISNRRFFVLARKNVVRNVNELSLIKGDKAVEPSKIMPNLYLLVLAWQQQLNVH